MTTPIEFRFDMDKMIETIIHLAQAVPGLTIRQLYAMLYFADKTMLENYGCFIYMPAH